MMLPGSKLDAQSALKHLQSLMEYLSVKASEEMDEGGEESEEAEGGEYAAGGEESEEKTPGMGIVIAMKPKGGENGKVPGCPDCEDGTPHSHMK